MVAEAEASARQAARRGAAARARKPALGRGRRQRLLSRGPCRRRRHRGAGLGRDAAAHVYALGRGARLQGRMARGERRRGGRAQIGDDPGQRPQRLWLAQDRERRASPGAHLALRLQRAAPHQLRLGLGLSGGRRQDRDRDPGQGSAHRHLSLLGRRRPARQQDRQRGAHHPSARAASSCSARASARSTRTAPMPWRCCARGSTRSNCRSARR